MNDEFKRMSESPLKFSLFLLKNLPSAYFSGLRVKQISSESCSITVPYKWFTRNPFRSTYFGCLAMAAEMSTGVLAMGNIYKRQPSVSMLVTALQAEYFKKASGITTFTCNDGMQFSLAVEDAVNGKASMLQAISLGYNKQGELIARFTITWSFKQRIKVT